MTNALAIVPELSLDVESVDSESFLDLITSVRTADSEGFTIYNLWEYVTEHLPEVTVVVHGNETPSMHGNYQFQLPNGLVISCAIGLFAYCGNRYLDLPYSTTMTTDEWAQLTTDAEIAIWHRDRPLQKDWMVLSGDKVAGWIPAEGIKLLIEVGCNPENTIDIRAYNEAEYIRIPEEAED